MKLENYPSKVAKNNNPNKNKISSFTTTPSFPSTRHSRALVSVAAALFLFKRRLTDTYDLGNLPKTGKGFAKVHASPKGLYQG